MGKKIDHITTHLQEFIRQQKIFFVGTAAADGRINISPKGLESLKILNANEILWLNLTGSGNETAAHLLENDRMTIMFCAFEGKPLILRLYGYAVIFHDKDSAFAEYVKMFPHMEGARQIIKMKVDLVQTSCGFGVPIMEFKEERDMLTKFAQQKGEAGIVEYWQDKNVTSIDGKDTKILERSTAGKKK
ncbi:MAG: pyridoxamine 5'-phosphate oxidase [Cytophagaceae bacterium]|nr:pyridoxamine 5'-phosphate oxidase [Cytophagaceae bacterium]|tara:strand:- start:350 stop:916 length:567 start_codon:yes stop_codon:yes gene_type:complete